MKNIVPRYKVTLVKESQIERSAYARFSNSSSIYEKQGMDTHFFITFSWHFLGVGS